MNRSRWIAVASGVLAGLGLHSPAQAGGGSSGSSSGDATGTSGSDTGEIGPCLVPLQDGSASASLTDDGSETDDDPGEDPPTSACLTYSEPDDGCECGPNEDPVTPLALLLPALALRRRGGRRDRLDQLADADRLPPDVIARLRARLDDDG